LEAIGLQRRPREVTPSLEQYLRCERVAEADAGNHSTAPLSNPALLGDVLDGDSWKPWRTLLPAAMGEELTKDERLVFKKFTGREREPGRRVEEYVGVKGRRAGGSYAGGKVPLP
jgi:hypothetical protein